MRIGIPKEIKPQEGRVAMLPAQVKTLVELGHEVIVQKGAGRLSGADDGAYSGCGARMADGGTAVFAGAELIVKVKELLPAEFGLLRKEHTLFTNIHGAADRTQVDRLLEAGLTAIAAEDTHEFGSPNSVLAGEIGALEGVRLVLAPHGGSGRHFMAHFGAPAAKALVFGLGGVGRGALRTLLGLGMEVVAFDVSAGARREAQLAWHKQKFRALDISEVGGYLADADLLINCVLWDKRRTDHLISRESLGQLKRGAVIVDISCDPAGAIETSRATKWEDPVYEVDGVRHFCVDNIPGAAPATASAGYAEALLPFVVLIAEHGAIEACRRNRWLARGLTCVAGELIHVEVGRVQERPFTPVDEFLGRHAAA